MLEQPRDEHNVIIKNSMILACYAVGSSGVDLFMIVIRI